MFFSWGKLLYRNWKDGGTNERNLCLKTVQKLIESDGDEVRVEEEVEEGLFLLRENQAKEKDVMCSSLTRYVPSDFSYVLS